MTLLCDEFIVCDKKNNVLLYDTHTNATFNSLTNYQNASALFESENVVTIGYGKYSIGCYYCSIFWYPTITVV